METKRPVTNRELRKEGPNVMPSEGEKLLRRFSADSAIASDLKLPVSGATTYKVRSFIAISLLFLCVPLPCFTFF